MKLGILRFYLDRWGDLVECEQNPCGCHPFDVIVTYPNKETHGKGRSVSLAFDSQQRINAMTRYSRWERLK